MNHLNIFTNKDRNLLVKSRKGESKFGEHVQVLPRLFNIYENLATLDVDFIVFGISEDVGVISNNRKSGTCSAWETVIKVLLNIQSNAFTDPKKVLILGYLDYFEASKSIYALNDSGKNKIAQAKKQINEIDTEVTHLVYTIIKAGKIPIIIGGGHNNAYGNIKGAALALNQKINAINFDAHSDFRAEEGRHNGNGFSYAFAEGFLRNYFIFGLHENYTSDKIFKTLDKIKHVKYVTYEALEIKQSQSYNKTLASALDFVSDKNFGIEIDCDAIEAMPSSAMTPSGFSVKQARQFVSYFGSHKNACYLHICEAIPTKKSEQSIGKLITYLITDFIRAKRL